MGIGNSKPCADMLLCLNSSWGFSVRMAEWQGIKLIKQGTREHPPSNQFYIPHHTPCVRYVGIEMVRV